MKNDNRFDLRYKSTIIGLVMLFAFSLVVSWYHILWPIVPAALIIYLLLPVKDESNEKGE